MHSWEDFTHIFPKYLLTNQLAVLHLKTCSHITARSVPQLTRDKTYRNRSEPRSDHEAAQKRWNSIGKNSPLSKILGIPNCNRVDEAVSVSDRCPAASQSRWLATTRCEHKTLLPVQGFQTFAMRTIVAGPSRLRIRDDVIAAPRYSIMEPWEYGTGRLHTVWDGFGWNISGRSACYLTAILC